MATRSLPAAPTLVLLYEGATVSHASGAVDDAVGHAGQAARVLLEQR